ncbi:MAG: hypothetical protein OXT65_05345 [Alphaproteobacteria bacterium]|nr:hypothetical protein [Alphaproteobacteria bacterium]
MGWRQQMQYRHQYTMDGSSSSAWQPTSVYQPERPARKNGKHVSFDEVVGVVSGFLMIAVTGLVCWLLGKVDWIAGLTPILKYTLIGSGGVSAFFIICLITMARAFRVLVRIIGIIIFLGIVAIPLALFLF